MRRWIWIGITLGFIACTKKQPQNKKAVASKTVETLQVAPAKPLYQAKDWAHVKAGTLAYPVGIKGAPTEVSITRGFWMKVTEVTQKEWYALMGNRPGQFKNCARCPVERVSWFDAVKYANRLSAAEAKPQCYSGQGVPVYTPIYDCPGYRLPTEAEWMLAASRHGHSLLDGASSVVAENSNQKTHQVGAKLPSSDGIFDLYGNVWEWCHDYYADWSEGRSIDPTGPATGKMRVARGGSWRSPIKDLTAFRPRFSHLPANKAPTRGFRLVRTQVTAK